MKRYLFIVLAGCCLAVYLYQLVIRLISKKIIQNLIVKYFSKYWCCIT